MADRTLSRRALRPVRTLLILAAGLAGGFHLGRASAPGPGEPHPHEYAPIRELTAADADLALEAARASFSGTTLEGEALSLDRLVEEHPLVLVTWFAEWCANCGYEAPALADLHRRWKDRGLAVVARSEYSHEAEVRRFLAHHGLHVPVLLGSPNPDPEREDEVRTDTDHYRFRRALGDERKWGTPTTLLLAEGGRRAWVVLGEFVPEELERFVAERLDPDGRVSDLRPPSPPPSGSSAGTTPRSGP